MPTPTPDYLLLDYDADADLLVGRWQRLVMPFELHQGYAALLDAAARHRCPYWLIDTSRRRVGIEASDLQWLRERFLPQVTARLGGPAYLAYLMAPHQLADLVSDPAVTLGTYSGEQACPLARFTQEAAARHWLGRCATQQQGMVA